MRVSKFILNACAPEKKKFMHLPVLINESDEENKAAAATTTDERQKQQSSNNIVYDLTLYIMLVMCTLITSMHYAFFVLRSYSSCWCYLPIHDCCPILNKNDKTPKNEHISTNWKCYVRAMFFSVFFFFFLSFQQSLEN